VELHNVQGGDVGRGTSLVVVVAFLAAAEEGAAILTLDGVPLAPLE